MRSPSTVFPWAITPVTFVGMSAGHVAGLATCVREQRVSFIFRRKYGGPSANSEIARDMDWRILVTSRAPTGAFRNHVAPQVRPPSPASARLAEMCPSATAGRQGRSWRLASHADDGNQRWLSRARRI
jgi:hypothetical protein